MATRTVSLAIRGPITRAGLLALTQRCCAFFAANAGCRVECDVGGCTADAVTVDALARMHLVAHKNQCVVALRNVSSDLVDLVELMGLADVLVVETRR